MLLKQSRSAWGVAAALAIAGLFTGSGLQAAVTGLGPVSVVEKVGKINASRVNVRARPTINSEVVIQLEEGSPVTVVDEITLETPAPEEPVKWSKIVYPADTMVWVHGAFISKEGQVAVSNYLNVRSGPGENFSKVGELKDGDFVQVVDRADKWVALAPRKDCYAYVASSLIEIVETKTVASTIPKPVKTVSSESAAAESSKIASGDESAAVGQETETESETEAEADNPETLTGDFESATIVATPDMTDSESGEVDESEAGADLGEDEIDSDVDATETLTEEIPESDIDAEGVQESEEPAETATSDSINKRRKVYREGILGRVVEPQYETIFRLKHKVTNRTMNLVQIDPEAEVDLKKYYGRTVWLEGYEYFDPRWPNSPLIEIKVFKVIK